MTERQGKILRGTVLGIIISILLVIVLLSLGGARKPAIYLYPESDSFINVKLDVNGIIVKEVPECNNGWNVFATKQGLINQKYDYLFYEALLKKVELPDSGWIVDYDNLAPWLEINLTKLGLNEKEKVQFMEYWIKTLPRANYYEIKLLDNKFLEENMNLIVSPRPDTVIRLMFHFKPFREKIAVPEPKIITPERLGFTVVEWGGILDIF